MSDSHYDTLGVEPDASRDEIRDAYRARMSELDPEAWKGDTSARRERAAAVNKAWNVLSDPFQKERYDRDLAGDSGRDVEIVLDDVEARSTNGRVKPSSTPVPDRAPPAAERGAGAVKLTPTGLTIAPTRARINALSVDVLVILVLVFGLNFLAGVLFSNQAVQVTVKGTIESTTEIKNQDPVALAKSERADAITKWEKDNKGKTPAAKDIKVEKVKVVPSGITLLFQLLTLVLALLYTVVPTLRGGQTLGKRFFKLKLVSVDGSPARWSQALLHYGIPIALAIALALLGAIVAIGMVVWSIWDKGGQGMDDKLAKTYVVQI